MGAVRERRGPRHISKGFGGCVFNTLFLIEVAAACRSEVSFGTKRGAVNEVVCATFGSALHHVSARQSRTRASKTMFVARPDPSQN